MRVEGNIGWIHLALNVNRWLPRVNTVRFIKDGELTKQLLALQQ